MQHNEHNDRHQSRDLFLDSIIYPSKPLQPISASELKEIRLLFNEYATTSLKVIGMAKEVANALQFAFEKIITSSTYSEEEKRLLVKAINEFHYASIIPQDVMEMVSNIDRVLAAIKANPTAPIHDITYFVPVNYITDNEGNLLSETDETREVNAQELSQDDLNFFFGIIHDFFRADDISLLPATAAAMLRTIRWARLNQTALDNLKTKLLENEFSPGKKEKNKGQPVEFEIISAAVRKPKTPEEEHAYALKNYLSVLMTRGTRLELQFSSLVKVYEGRKKDALHTHLLALQMKMQRHVCTTERYDLIGDQQFIGDIESLHAAAEVDLMVTVGRKAGKYIEDHIKQSESVSDISVMLKILDDNIEKVMRIMRQQSPRSNDISTLKIHFRQLEVAFGFLDKALVEENVKSNGKEYCQYHAAYNSLLDPFIRFLNRRNAGVKDGHDISNKAEKIIAEFQKQVAILAEQQKKEVEKLNAEKEKEASEALEAKEQLRLAHLVKHRRARPRLQQENWEAAPTSGNDAKRHLSHSGQFLQRPRSEKSAETIKAGSRNNQKQEALFAACSSGIDNFLNEKPSNNLFHFFDRHAQMRALSYKTLFSNYTEPFPQLFLMYTLLASHAEKSLQKNVLEKCKPFFPQPCTLKQVRGEIIDLMDALIGKDKDTRIATDKAVGHLVDKINGKEIVREFEFPAVKSKQLKKR